MYLLGCCCFSPLTWCSDHSAQQRLQQLHILEWVSEYEDCKDSEGARKCGLSGVNRAFCHAAFAASQNFFWIQVAPDRDMACWLPIRSRFRSQKKRSEPSTLGGHELREISGHSLDFLSKISRQVGGFLRSISVEELWQLWQCSSTSFAYQWLLDLTHWTSRWMRWMLPSWKMRFVRVLIAAWDFYRDLKQEAEITWLTFWQPQDQYEEITSTIFPAFSLISLKFEETVSKFEGSKEILTHQSITQ